jgi:hypothetical protein
LNNTGVMEVQSLDVCTRFVSTRQSLPEAKKPARRFNPSQESTGPSIVT